MATSNHDHVVGQSPTTPTERFSIADRTREVCRSIATTVGLVTADNCNPHGDWRPGTLSTTKKVWTHPTTGAEMTIESAGLSAGWTATLRLDGVAIPIVPHPMARDHVFAKARKEMRRHAEATGTRQ